MIETRVTSAMKEVLIGEGINPAGKQKLAEAFIMGLKQKYEDAHFQQAKGQEQIGFLSVFFP